MDPYHHHPKTVLPLVVETSLPVSITPRVKHQGLLKPLAGWPHVGFAQPELVIVHVDLRPAQQRAQSAVTQPLECVEPLVLLRCSGMAEADGGDGGQADKVQQLVCRGGSECALRRVFELEAV